MKAILRKTLPRTKSLSLSRCFITGSCSPASKLLLPPIESSHLRFHRRLLHSEHNSREHDQVLPLDPGLQALPWSCPGCGAYTQSHNAGEPGYFSPTRKPVRAYIAAQKAKALPDNPTDANGVCNRDSQTDNLPASNIDRESNETPPMPICDRCHNLRHHQEGIPIAHPTIQSIQDLVLDSPYKYNHIYHVLDAADFPLSVIPNIHRRLGISPQRSRNRRSQSTKFYHGQNTEMSFIITRSDLLAPRKEQVDAMMPKLQRILREALDSAGDGIRLGNVRCVSAHRGWWTKKLKEDIWKHGGGCWMVGRVNVGKSNLFDSVFPKGHKAEPSASVGTLHNPTLEKEQPRIIDEIRKSSIDSQKNEKGGHASYNDHNKTTKGLLPPRPAETKYPPMPLVSHLPGTTASPIRVPFGAGKGELIDLPGLARGSIEDYVLDEHKPGLIMQQRVKATQCSIKPGQSLLLSNLVRITPKSPDVVFLACPFVPLPCHVTNTEKAKAVLAQEVDTAVPGITKPGAGAAMASAGTFALKWDVTKLRAGPLTADDAAAISTQKLPFKIYSTDILIEGIGWVELAAQVRKKPPEQETDEQSPSHAGEAVPLVEVFSPAGKHIGSRETLSAWVIGGQKRRPVSQRKVRPRRSMKGMKKSLKQATRVLV